MPNQEKTIQIVEFLGKKTNWESWPEKFLLHGKQKGYKELLVNSGSMSSVDKIPSQDEWENVFEGCMDFDK